jgi:hypothetical protein
MDALSDNGFSKFNGHGAHKRAIATEAAQDLTNGDSQLSKRLAAEDDRNTLGFATTVYHPHTCVAFSASHQEIDKLKSVSEAGSSAAPNSEGPTSASGLQVPVYEGDDTEDESDDERSDNKRLKGGYTSGYTNAQLAASVSDHFRSLGLQPAQARTRDVKDFLQSHFDMGHRVVRVVRKVKLQDGKFEFGGECSSYLLQGLIEHASSEGHYCVPVIATGTEVTEQAIALAKSRYYKRKKRELQGSNAKVPAFNKEKAGCKVFEDVTSERLPIDYIIGWVLVPNYMRINLKHFVPWSAIDVTFAKTYAGAQGCFYLEATLDAENYVHPLGIMHIFTVENNYGYGLFHFHMLEAYQPAVPGEPHPLLVAGRVVAGDGNSGIPATLAISRPGSHFIRDIRHLKSDMRAKLKIRKVFEQLYEIPPSGKEAVLRILAALELSDPEAHAALMTVPLHQWCPAMMPDKGINTHSNHTSNAVEILALMIMELRKEPTLAGSLRLALKFVRSRHIDTQELAVQCRSGIGPRLAKSLHAVQERATARNAVTTDICAVQGHGMLGQHVTVTIQSMCVCASHLPLTPHFHSHTSLT